MKIIEIINIMTTLSIPVLIWYFKVKIPVKIQHDYNKKLSELENKFKLEQKMIEDLRRNAILGAEKRQEILSTRKFKACDELWEKIENVASLKVLSTYLMAIKEDKFIKSDYNNSNNSLFIESFGKISGFESQKEVTTTNKLFLQRPYLSERLWALYLAHSSVSAIVIYKYEFLKSGSDMMNLINYSGVLNLIKKVEPSNFSTYTEINSFNISIVLEILENKILNEIKKIHSGFEEDKKSIEINREIIKYANKISTINKVKDK